MRTEYSNERKQCEPIPKPLLGTFIPAIFSRLRFHLQRTCYFITRHMKSYFFYFLCLCNFLLGKKTHLKLFKE